MHFGSGLHPPVAFFIAKCRKNFEKNFPTCICHWHHATKNILYPHALSPKSTARHRTSFIFSLFSSIAPLFLSSPLHPSIPSHNLELSPFLCSCVQMHTIEKNRDLDIWILLFHHAKNRNFIKRLVMWISCFHYLIQPINCLLDLILVLRIKKEIYSIKI